MATAANAPRSWLRPRFSLRVLLLAVTAFAIGFPVWYRWPYEEVEILPPSGRGKPVVEQRITTWQRQWGGEPLKHGPHRIVRDGKTFELTTYRNGRKHGQYYLTFGDPKDAALSGQFVDDEMDGVWSEIVNGRKRFTTFDHGKLVSPTITPPPP
jgi:hypothetical protein